MASRIVATFNSKKAADKATKALKDANIEPGTDTPENGGHTVVIAPLSASISTTSGNAIAPVVAPTPVGNAATDVDEERDRRTGQTIISVSVRDDAAADRVMAIVRENGGTTESQGASSTLDEVANPAQSPDRLR